MVKQRELSVEERNELTRIRKDGKLAILIRSYIIELNKKIDRELTKITGNRAVTNKTKKDLRHMVVDQNNTRENGNLYDGVDWLVEDVEYFYRSQNVYTLASYYVFYSAFIERILNKEIKDNNDIKPVMKKAWKDVKDLIKTSNLSFSEYMRGEDFKFLKAEMRKDVIRTLRKDLKIKDMKNYLEQYMMNKNMGEHKMRIPASDKIYVNNVEEYKDENGVPYYLDADGNVYQKDEVNDFSDGTIIMTIDEDGVKEMDYVEEDDERCM